MLDGVQGVGRLFPGAGGGDGRGRAVVEVDVVARGGSLWVEVKSLAWEAGGRAGDGEWRRVWGRGGGGGRAGRGLCRDTQPPQL